MPVNTLKKRAEFLRVRGGARWSSEAFLLEAKVRLNESQQIETPGKPLFGPRFGFTVTKKMGNAVRRNRIRRRLKAAVDQVAVGLDRQDCDYVLLARTGAIGIPYAKLVRDLETAIRRIHAKLESRKPANSAQRRKKTSL